MDFESGRDKLGWCGAGALARVFSYKKRTAEGGCPYVILAWLTNLFAYRLALVKQVGVIRAAGFRVGARHVESAKGMRADHGSRTFAVDIEITDMEFANGAVNLLA